MCNYYPKTIIQELDVSDNKKDGTLVFQVVTLLLILRKVYWPFHDFCVYS